MKNLLVAVDGSESAQKAAEKALELAKALSAKVTIISVSAPALAPLRIQGVAPHYNELLEMQRKQAQETAEGYRGFFEKENLEVSIVTRQGDPATEIIQASGADDYYMLIVGSRGLTGIKRAVIGSVANYVIQGSKVPVLVVT